MTDLTKTDDWKCLPWFKIEHEVFRIQRRIFNAARSGDRKKMLELQNLLLKSRFARLLAVRKAAQDSKGRHTPGVDGQKSLTQKQMIVLAKKLRLNWKTRPVRRIHVPKDHPTELRPLGIPTIADRAHQHLINLALEPQAEARFSPHQFGFRRGRSPHDAIMSCRSWILRAPQWALRIDIKRFFDNLDHDVAVAKLDTFPAMETAIRRILKSGAYEGSVFTSPESGTPQGGPLSPLIANTALCDLEKAIHDAFPPGRIINGITVGKRPRIVIYADDATVMHPNPKILEAVSVFIETWLQPLGLALNQKKTTMSHTLEKHNGTAGFDFVGLHIQQFKVGRHQLSPFFRGAFTCICPSKASVKRLRRKVKHTIKSTTPLKRNRARETHRAKQGLNTYQEVLIFRLNRIIRGWANYHRPHNATRIASSLDFEFEQMLLRWAIRHHKRKPREWIVKQFFNRDSPWIFKSPRKDKDIQILKIAEQPIRRHISVQSKRSYFDGDSIYWASRSGRYPGIRPAIARRIKYQRGKCAECKIKFTRHDQIMLKQFFCSDINRNVFRAVHLHCNHPHTDRDSDQHLR